MKSFIVLSCLSLSTLALSVYVSPYHQAYAVQAGYHGPPAPLGHDGQVVDTPEVAHAKQAHLAAYAAEAAKTAHFAGVDEYAADGNYDDSGAYHHGMYQAAYHGPLAPLGHDGRVVDTPEVTHAKAAHLAAHAKELSKIAHLSYLDPYSHAKW